MQSKSEATKQKIFEVGLQLFAQQGYGSTTIRDIAKKADISTGLLFHYFPNKQALLTSHLELAASGMTTIVQTLESSRTPLKTFSSIAELTLESLKSPAPRLLYLLMNQPLPQDIVSEQLRQKIKKHQIIKASLPLIKLGQKSEQIKPGDPLALAVAFWGSIQGTAEVLVEQTDSPIPDPIWLVDILKA
jgi:AcrR family transcriptional regulator